MYIENVSKNQIKYLKSLKLKKNRQNYGSFLAEGRKVVSEILRDAAALVRGIYACDTWLNNYNNPIPSIPIHRLSDEQLNQTSSFSTPDQVIVECAIPVARSINHHPLDWILYMDSIADPGNLGTIIRTCDWYGLDQVFLSPGTVDCYNPKTIQASMGSIVRVACHYLDFDKFIEFFPNKNLYLAKPEGRSVKHLTQANPGILVVGSETHGISSMVEDRPHLDIAVKSHPKSKADSLNAAIATASLLAILHQDLE